MSRACLAAVALALAACDPANPDPCADATAPCIALTVTASSIDRIDQLEIDLLYGALHDSFTTQLAGPASLPVATAIRLAIPITAPEVAALSVAGKLGGNVLGTGAASPSVPPEGFTEVEIALTPPQTCVADSFYCGGDKLAGDPGVLYVCNGGGVPFARARCAGECLVNPDSDDACSAVGGPCTEGGDYCGGNEVAGDPQSLYQCVNGVGRNRRECPNGCLIRPGLDDMCR